MRVASLVPLPDQCTQFAWSHHVTVPDKPGCYVLATYAGEVLYVGLATSSIRARMGCHLATPGKRGGGDPGVPFWFYYLVCSTERVAPIERGWMNQSTLADGRIPVLNKIQSPL